MTYIPPASADRIPETIGYSKAQEEAFRAGWIAAIGRRSRFPASSADRWTRLCLLLREAQQELRHTECREGDANCCPACDIESRIDSILEEEKA